jgi:hypothetical protein
MRMFCTNADNFLFASGAFGVVWFVLWMVIAYNEPSTHPRISDVERDYIEQSIGGTRKEHKNLGTPWLKFATSLPIWAIIVGHTCANWGTYMFLTNLPTYMKDILRFDIKSVRCLDLLRAHCSSGFRFAERILFCHPLRRFLALYQPGRIHR